MDPLEIRAQPSKERGAVDFLIHSPQAGMVAVAPLQLAKVQDGTPVQPLMSIPAAQAHTLMEDLWACGFRPGAVAGLVGELMATKRHLEDLRQIVLGRAESPQPRSAIMPPVAQENVPDGY